MNILAIGAHPDDIDFGCGGAMLRFARAGHDVFIYVVTGGGMGGDTEVRRSEQMEAARFIGVKRIFWGGYKDTQIPLTKELITDIENVLKQIQPDYIFVHYGEDTHQDHRILSRATLSATRYVPNFLFYEGPTTVNFSPNVYIDIEEVADDKLELLRKHKSQVSKVISGMPELTIVDFASSTARFRGIQGRLKSAEAFQSLRLLIDITAR
ncbi:MAG: PIG-L family deacetylase [Candidatus Latescibacteria bacterium]|nr:PIG-L family deacetylase [Candidatus Latescibacterota bacterium]